jgi:hypothetical protein
MSGAATATMPLAATSFAKSRRLVINERFITFFNKVTASSPHRNGAVKNGWFEEYPHPEQPDRQMNGIPVQIAG